MESLTTDAITTDGLVVRRGSFTLGPLDLRIPRGYVTGFLGVNGSGKTTTLRTLLGLVRQTSGTFAMPAAEGVGVALENPCLVPDWTVRQAARAIAPFRPGWDDAHVEALWTRFGLRPDEKVKDLSRGESGKLGVSLALGNRPALLILDEPTSGLDPDARLEIVDVLREHLAGGERTLIFSTHITSDLEDFADHLVLIRDGRLHASGPADAIRERYATVRGAVEDLTPDVRAQLAGIRVRGERFDGLVYVDQLAGLPPTVDVVEATLDHIVALLGAVDSDTMMEVAS